MTTNVDTARTAIELAQAEDEGTANASDAVQPVSYVPGDAQKQPEDGIGICLSGGGSRAMVFHVGALHRLNEVRLLRKANRISGVSGGSITGGVLGLGWRDLRWDGPGGSASNLEAVLKPIESFAAKAIDVHAVVEGVLLPFENAADRLDHEFDKHLFHGKTLQDLPADAEGPRFIFNATNLSSSVLWRFSRPYAWDWRVGEIEKPPFRVSTAVAASAAFPPFFAPLELNVDPSMFTPGSGRGLELPDYQHQIRLADGGVYDNLGLETIFKKYRTVFASDGGGQVADDPRPPSDWIRETLRMTSVIDHQVRSLRKRLLIAAYQRGDRTGAYWGIRQQLPAGNPLSCPPDQTMALANLPTRLDGMTDQIRDRLINWGYAAADAAISQWYGVSEPAPSFPRAGGVG
ncbi:MAG TPA: patatin-like phospholipase family protein [Candidatus Limnocylindrales bacterium]